MVKGLLIGEMVGCCQLAEMDMKFMRSLELFWKNMEWDTFFGQNRWLADTKRYISKGSI